jgi:hypothetical protein
MSHKNRKLSSIQLAEELIANRHSPATIRRKFTSRARPESPESPRKFFNIADRKAHSVKFDKNAIIKAAGDNDCYHIRRYKLLNLPKFDDCKPYVTGSDNITELFTDEVEKLIEFAELDQPPIFNSHDCLRGAGLKDFEELSHLADQMTCISHVLTHDNSRHGVTFGLHAANEAWESLVESRSHLRMRYAKDEKHMEGGQPIILEDCGQSERNARAFHFLLDHILGIMVWWLVRCADSEYWRTQILATLAQRAVKMKVICRNPARCADTSLSETSGMIEQLKIQADENEVLIKIGGKKKDASSVQTQTDYCNLYIEEKLWIRDALEKIFVQVLRGLAQDEKLTTPADLFEVCAMIFRKDTEPDRGGKIWAGLRHGDVGVSSSLKHISFSYSLTTLLNMNINTLKDTDRPPQPPLGQYVKLNGYVHENGITIHNLKVYSMDHVLTLMIPLLLMQPMAVASISKLMNSAMAFMDGKEIIRVFNPPPNDFALELTLSSRAWLQDSETSRVLDPDITSLSRSSLRRKFLRKTTRYAHVTCANEVEQMQQMHHRLDQPEWNIYGRSTLQNLRI